MDEERSLFQYCHTTFFGIVIGASQMMIGAVLTSMLMFSLKTDFKDKHVMWSIIGFHFFSVQAILTTNVVSGWASQFEVRHRYYVHGVMQICAIICVLVGMSIAISDYGTPETPHAVLGILATTFAIIATITGPLALFMKWPFQIIHIGFGIPTFVMSSACVVSGLCKPVIENMFGKTAITILITFVLFYSVFISILSFIKLILRIKNEYDEELDFDDDE